MKLYIRNMVCARCLLVVRAEMERLELNNIVVKLGRAECEEELSILQLNRLNKRLIESGLELIENKKEKLIREIKQAVSELIEILENSPKNNLSEFISEKLNYSYPAISKIFSESEGQSIEKYFIKEKIELVKRLHTDKGLTLTEISYLLNYSSVSHLSAQFKKVTGLTASDFKVMQKQR